MHRIGRGDCLPGAVTTYFDQPILPGIGFAVALFWIKGAPYYMAFAACYRLTASPHLRERYRRLDDGTCERGTGSPPL